MNTFFKYKYLIYFLFTYVFLINTSFSKDFDPDFYNNKDYSKHSYVCVPTEKSGFKYNKVTRKWDSVTDKSSSEKKLFKWKDNKWILSNFGKKDEEACINYEYVWAYKSKKPIKDRSYTISLKCTQKFGEFIFNKDTLKYLKTNTSGYASTLDVDETAYVEIGTCAKL